MLNKIPLFIHIPKCAGTAVSQRLKQYIPVRIFGPHFKCRTLLGRDWKQHRGISGCPECTLVRDNLYIFSFVRNPWDRLVSIYHYFHQAKEVATRRRKNTYLQGLTKDFKTFVMNIDKWFTTVEDGSIYEQSLLPHFRPQHEFVCDKDGNLLVDFIGKVENLHADMQVIGELYGFKPPAADRVNASVHKPYESYYDKETSDIVKQYYARDIELFQYDAII